jgi:hypothetical protein
MDVFMHSIFKSGARPGVGDNLFLTSAAAYKNILQMQEAPLMDESQKKIASPWELGIEPNCYQRSSC